MNTIKTYGESYLSNSNLISCFLSSSFFWSSWNPLSMFFICWNLSLFSSSLT
jgi:hypothetical protein